MPAGPPIVWPMASWFGRVRAVCMRMSELRAAAERSRADRGDSSGCAIPAATPAMAHTEWAGGAEWTGRGGHRTPKPARARRFAALRHAAPCCALLWRSAMIPDFTTVPLTPPTAARQAAAAAAAATAEPLAQRAEPWQTPEG